MSLYNLNEFAKAKVIVKELEKALKVINAAEASLRAYEKYRPVNTILTTIYNEKPFLELFLEQYRVVVETKGSRKR